jgi:hypothetical protein
MGRPGHLAVQILSHSTVSHWDFWKIQVTKNNLYTIRELKQEILVIVFSINEGSSCSCVKFPTSAANSHGHWWCTYWKSVCIISFPRLLNSETPSTLMFAILFGNCMQWKAENLFEKPCDYQGPDFDDIILFSLCNKHCF